MACNMQCVTGSTDFYCAGQFQVACALIEKQNDQSNASHTKSMVNLIGQFGALFFCDWTRNLKSIV